MTDEFDGYRKWLGISNKNRLPSHYELLAISLDEDDPEVIRAAIEQRRHFVESKRGDGHDSVVTEILYRIGEAETTLLNSEMRRDYDRQLNLFEKRRKNRQVDPFAPRSRVKSRPGPTVGEDHGILNTFAGIVAIVCVAFGIMAWFSFQLPWTKIEKQAEPAPVVRGPVELPAQPPEATVAEQTEPAQAQPADPIKPVMGAADKANVAPIKANTPPKSPDPHRLLTGHTADVNQLAVSPDGQFIASASRDRTIRLWNQGSGKQVWSTPWGKSDFKALAFESNGKRLWAANEQGACSIDTESGTATDVLEFRCSGPAVFGKNCSLLAISGEGNLRVFNTAQRKPLKTHDAWSPKLAFNNDATLLLMGGNEGGDRDGAILSFRLSSEKRSGEFTGLRDRTFALQISPDDKYVAAASGCAKSNQPPEQNRVVVWDASNGKKVMDHAVSEGWCEAVAFSSDGKLLVAGGCGRASDWGGHSRPNANKVFVWRINDGREIATFTGHTAIIQALAFTPDGMNIVSSGADHTIRIWSVATANPPADREVANWVLSKGGKISITTNGGEPIEIRSQDALLQSEFALHTVDLLNLKEIGDQDLRRLNGLKSLSVLTVMGTSVTDAGLKELADITTLTSLNVAGTSVNGSGFQHLSTLNKLENVLCGGAPIADANLGHLKKLQSLKKLGLIGTPVTDAGMPTLASLKGLLELRLNDTKVTDKGLAHLKSLKNLEKLSLIGSGVSKKGTDSIRAALPKCEVKPD